jgi:hypothetical protein
MAKDSDKLRGGFDVGETGGALSGLLADDEELDRGALWRLGTWAAVSVGAVIVALIANQSSIGVRREQSASADLLKQAQQLQLTAREGQSETRRLASAVDTLNSDRDRLYSRVAVLEQGLDSVTGTIARQSPAAPPANASQASPPATPGQGGLAQGGASQASASQGSASQATSQGNAGATASTGASAPSASTSPPAAGPTASSSPAAPATTASVEPQAPAAKPSPTPVVAPVTATAPAIADKAAASDKVAEKQDKQAPSATSSELGSVAKPTTAQQSVAAQPSGSLMASKSMMGPPDPAAGKLIEPATLPKIAATTATTQVAAVTPKAPDETEAASPSAAPELLASRTEFGVDVGGANSIPGLRALWRGLRKSKSNAALSKLRPIIVIKENNNGLGMQLRLVAGPISDAAAAAKICASLTISDRGCSTAVFEGQRLALGADDVDKSEASKAEADDKPAATASRQSSHRHYYSSRRPKVEDAPPPKPEPSTLSRLFGKRE